MNVQSPKIASKVEQVRLTYRRPLNVSREQPPSYNRGAVSFVFPITNLKPTHTHPYSEKNRRF